MDITGIIVQTVFSPSHLIMCATIIKINIPLVNAWNSFHWLDSLCFLGIFCDGRFARLFITFNGCTTIFGTTILLFYMCNTHSCITKACLILLLVCWLVPDKIYCRFSVKKHNNCYLKGLLSGRFVVHDCN